MSTPLLQRLSPALAAAAGYALLGWLSLMVAIPPDYVSLVFLPAGLALGLTLVQGPAVLPGVYLGSLAVQLLAAHQAGVLVWAWTLLLPPLGAVLQAAVGAWAARRLAGYPGPLDTPGHVTLLLLAICPLSALINASLSVPTLWASGVIPEQEALFSWWTWWLGDALGSVLMLPLVLVFLGRPAEHWRPRRLSVALPLALAMLLVGAGILEVRMWETERVTRQMEQRSQELGSRLQRRLDAQADSVMAVARLMQMTAPLSQDDFGHSVRHWLERYPNTQNFGWSPLVTDGQRALYESVHGSIKGRQPGGQTHPAPRAAEHLPITLVEPLQGNRSVLGLDITVLPTTAAATARTRATGLAATTEGFRLVQESGEQRAVVMYQAVAEPHQPQLKGVVSAVFRMDDVLNAAIGPATDERPEVCLVDLGAPAANRRLAGPPGCEAPDWLPAQMGFHLPMRFGGRDWEAHFRPPATFANSARNWTAWATLGLALTCVGLLGAFLLVITGQARRTRELVDLRTAELAELAHFDSLTGLPNRTHWMHRAQGALQQAQQHGHQLAILFLDLDHFKHVNDTLGHALGDQLLRVVAQRLQPCLRQGDLLARIGGDEFVVLLPQLRHPDDAAAVADKLALVLADPVTLQGHEINLSVSMGIACQPRDGEDLDTLLKHADTAMYAAKEAGRNGYQFFQADMNERLSQRMFIETHLRRALERDELFLVYQPQYDARSGRASGVEALVRWRHPELGLIPPDRFIPVAEDCGLIEGLGAWVLRQACAQLRAWDHAGVGPLMMAVNISPLQFRKAGFVDTVREALASTGIDPSQLELEITETLLMQPQHELNQRLDLLAGMGLTFALDDFGTGYSSLGYLRRLPISRIKLDKSFVRDVPGHIEGEAVARATLSMTKDLGLQCVAEGVETEAQKRFLIANGCDYLQGYLLARPMPADECLAWLRQHPSSAPAPLNPII